MTLKVAIVTPYYKEPTEMLRHCHESVVAQTYPSRHFMVADGYPNPELAALPSVTHLALPMANGDNGNTPRAIGGILAEAYGYDAVGYLDADNWLAPNHTAAMIEAHQRHGTPLVCCKRVFCQMDGTAMAVTEADEDANKHVDTSCWMVFRPAFPLLRGWLMPKVLGPVCDRVFLQKVVHERYGSVATDERTVYFRTQYAVHYRAAGLAVPPGAKNEGAYGPAREYLLSAKGVREIVAMMGFYPII